jgi:hypothetical protein
VVDSGFDDASCFLRDEGAQGLNGTFNETLMVRHVKQR